MMSSGRSEVVFGFYSSGMFFREIRGRKAGNAREKGG